MIESRALPLDGRVTQLAVLREGGRDVIRVHGPVEVRQVTGNARRGSPRKVSLCMTRRAGRRRMCAHQGKLRAGMVKGGRCPPPRAMTYLAGLREPGGGVIRIRRRSKVLQVTGDARCRRTCENALRMA